MRFDYFNDLHDAFEYGFNMLLKRSSEYWREIDEYEASKRCE